MNMRVVAGGASIVVCLVLFAASPVLAQALDEAAMRALEARCETARETALAPLRAARIQACTVEQRKDPAYCERYWRDFGSGYRTADGRWIPRMFDDLPECVAVRKARRGWVRP